MKVKLAQLGAIIRYELLMHWRKRGLIAFLVLILIGMLALTMSMAYEAEEPQMPPELSAETVDYLFATNLILTSAMPVMLLVALGLPLLMAEIIPLDRYIGVRELLDGTPLSQGIYLAGKVAGASIFMLAGLTTLAVVYGLVQFALLGPFSLIDYLLMWAFGIIPAALYVTAIGVLIPAGQPTRRRGMFVGLGVAVFNLLTVATLSLSARDIVSPLRPTLLMALQKHWLEKAFEITTQEVCAANIDICGIGIFSYSFTFHPAQIELTLLSTVIQIVLVWWLMSTWLRYKEATQ